MTSIRGLAAGAAAAAALSLGAACGDRTGKPSPAAAPGTTAGSPRSPVTTAPFRPGLPTVPDDDRRTFPTMNGSDGPVPHVVTRTILLETNRAAVVITVPDAVLFAFGSHELRPEAETVLQQVIDHFRRNPGAIAEVAGHTDAIGDAEHNRLLSERRAAAVAEWLAAHGVAPARLRAVGYGASHPVAGNDTAADRRRNRRVELTLTL